MKSRRSESRAGRVMRLHEALDYPCPFCGAKPEELCFTAHGAETYEHTARLILRNYVESSKGPERSDNSRVARLARTLRAGRAASPR